MLVGNPFSLDTFWKIHFSTFILRSCCSCYKCSYFCLELGIKKETTFNWSNKEFEIFWWCWTTFSIWQVSSLFNLQQVHRNLNQTLDICVESKTRICFCKKERKKREILIVQPPRQQKNNFSKKLLNMGADNFMVLRIRWMHKLAMYFKLNLPLQGVTPLP